MAIKAEWLRGVEGLVLILVIFVFWLGMDVLTSKSGRIIANRIVIIF